MKPSTTTQAALSADILVCMGVPAHERFEVQPADDAFGHHRVVTFDAAQFADSGPHERLSEFAARRSDPGALLPDAIRRFLAPDVPANRGQFVEYALYNYNDGLLSLDNSVDESRALEADFPALRHPPHQLVTQRVANRGLTLEVDEEEGCLGAGWQQAKVAFLRAAIDRARLRRTVALFVAGAVSVGKTWDASTHPDTDVMEELDAQSLRASRIMYDPRAWAQRGRALRERETDGESASATMSPETLAREFAVEEVQVVRANSAPGLPTAQRPAGGQVLLFCAADALSRNDFSNLKTFTAPAKTGERYAAYVSQGRRQALADRRRMLRDGGHHKHRGAGGHHGWLKRLATAPAGSALRRLNWRAAGKGTQRRLLLCAREWGKMRPLPQPPCNFPVPPSATW